MPSRYISEPQQEQQHRLSEREGGGGGAGKMVSVANSPNRPPSAAGREPKKEQKTFQNGGLPHLVLVRAPHPKPSATVPQKDTRSSPPPAPRVVSDRLTVSADEVDTESPVRTGIRTLAQPSGSTGDTRCCRETREEGEKSVCPQAAISYTSGILSRRAEGIRCRQLSLDDRLRRLHGRVRSRQGKGVCHHVQSQLRYAGVGVCEGEIGEDGSSEITSAATIPMQVDGAVEDVCADRVAVARSLNFESFDHSDQSKHDTSQAVDVVGNSGQPKPERASHTPNPTPSTANSEAPQFLGQLRNRSNKFRGKRLLSDGRSEVVERWRQQLRGVCGGVGEDVGVCRGGEVTDTSSDEEGDMESMEESRRQKRLQEVCRRWERSRGPIGAQWAWLRHRISEINRKLSHLDTAMQTCPKPEKFVLAPGSSRTFTRPAPLWGPGVERSKVTNGTNHTSSIPHLLIPDGILNGPIQVKDLLSPTPLMANMPFILDDFSGYTCARTRALMKKPGRKVVRLRRGKRVGRSHAPKPVLPRDTPSWVWLDEGLQRVLRDHPYASVPVPIPKRRHRVTAANRLRAVTSSPSPAAAELDPGSPAKVCQKRLLHELCPRSPSVSRSSTPTPFTNFTTSTPSTSTSSLTPSLPRKKRLLSHAPSYDIDNIVIPYSVAAATRPEKLEYKEVLTPGWREVPATPTGHTPSSAQSSSVEDSSDECFRSRHEKFEANEKKRFMNFISGGQRKRTRPSSLSSTTPDPAHNPTWPPGKVRRATFPASPSDHPSRVVPVLSWPPRSFPLQGADIEALTNPPPPPPLPLPVPRNSSSSPSPLLCRPLTPSLPATPTNSSLVATPLSSPSTPYSEHPISPAEWAVNPQIMPIARVSTTPGSIVLRLTKKN